MTLQFLLDGTLSGAMIGLGGPEMLEKIAPIEGRLARLGFAARAELSDLYKTLYTYMSVAGMPPEQAMKNLEINYKQGKLGSFELKDMARYLPSLGPAAAAAGFTGENGLRDLVSMLQVMRKGSGTSEEAAASMQNVLQKMMSEETAKRFKKFGVKGGSVVSQFQHVAQNRDPPP